MQTLYLLGTGFDKAHGLPTSYSDFRTHLSLYHEEFLLQFEAMYHIHPLDCSEPWYSAKAQAQWNASIENNLWQTFEEKIGHPDIDGMYAMAQSIKDSMPEEGIKDTLDLHWKEMFGFSNLLQEYVLEWIKSIDTSNTPCRKKSLIGRNNDLFLNFNYTETLEKVYNIKDVLHIHGCVSDTALPPPIMGHGNKKLINEYRQKAYKAYNNGIEWEASICFAIYKYCESLLKDTERIIALNNDFFSNLQDVDHIVSIGLSWGNVDIPYLKRLAKEVNPSAKWTVCYRSDKKRLVQLFSDLGIKNVTPLHCDSFWDK